MDDERMRDAVRTLIRTDPSAAEAWTWELLRRLRAAELARRRIQRR